MPKCDSPPRSFPCVGFGYIFGVYKLFAFSLSFNSIGHNMYSNFESQKRHAKWPWCNINHNVFSPTECLTRTHTHSLSLRTKFISFLISINSSWLMRANVVFASHHSESHFHFPHSKAQRMFAREREFLSAFSAGTQWMWTIASTLANKAPLFTMQTEQI